MYAAALSRWIGARHLCNTWDPIKAGGSQMSNRRLPSIDRLFIVRMNPRILFFISGTVYVSNINKDTPPLYSMGVGRVGKDIRLNSLGVSYKEFVGCGGL